MIRSESSKIDYITAREILDSRGNPTVEATVVLKSGKRGVASVPSGASTGSYEAWERRDADMERYGGRGVLGAVHAIRDEISPALAGKSALEQAAIDHALIELDGTDSKGRLGANATLAVSLAVARAAAEESEQELFRYLGGAEARRLPVPCFNIINGGAHATNNLEIQEFMIAPVGMRALTEGVRAAAEIYRSLKGLLIARGLSTGVGDEGGFAPDLESDEAAIELIVEAIEVSGYTTDQVKIALDVASTEWFTGGEYILEKGANKRSADELISYYEMLVGKYPIFSIEDGLAEDDTEGWKRLTERLGKKIMLVGDDLFVTNVKRLRDGIKRSIANAILIKPNQIGTLSETLDVIRLAHERGYSFMVSHRSGETEDSFIADLAAATNAPYIKAGAPARGERVAKYNRLMAIEAMLGCGAVYG